MENIFIIGSKGMGNYGGYETFVENLSYYKKSDRIKYHIACIGKKEIEIEHNKARCFYITIPNIGAVSSIIYDLKALKKCFRYIEKNKMQHAIIYILACRLGPFLYIYKKKAKKLGIKIYLNPDGHEWLREKWSKPIRMYWKISERIMVKNADLIICDSRNIEKYINKAYNKYCPNTKFIAYGADMEKSKLLNDDEKIKKWYQKNDVQINNYYLVVARLVPENNFKKIILEFMKSNTKKDLVIITNFEHNKFFKKLKKETKFENDKRIKFVGTMYEKEILKKIRENAYAYIHGHSVGGTNPSLIEALATTNLNLLYDVRFNKEVAEEGALYWTLKDDNLATLINKADNLSQDEIAEIGIKAKSRIKKEYTWQKIIDKYENIFLGEQ